jgi:hypothetical protein
MTNLLMPALVIVATWFGGDPEMEDGMKERNKQTEEQTEKMYQKLNETSEIIEERNIHPYR